MLRIAGLTAFFLFFAGSATADIFRYVDENGVVCYTDSPFGKKVEKVMREKQETERPLTTSLSHEYSGYVQKAASRYEIEPELINAIIKTESNGNHRAVSRKGAMGLMQLMPSTASDMNVGNPFNPQENIDGGTKYFKYLLEKFNGDTTLALAAYNAGPKTVEKYRAIPPISETRDYVKKVYALYRGKRSYPVSEPVKKEAPMAIPTPVYKVQLDDGTVLFTNSYLARTAKARF
ncbi:MAG: lytic transglycosylase domain-containing protein [Nitrospirae bacterium]|nr:lytic transglycosylase domain-containing protein [Nitrospirota bacterium]